MSSGGAADWDLDEALGLAPGMDLVVAVPQPSETQQDGPWPRGRTPADDEFELEPSEIAAAAGFGAPPSNALSAALYFVRVTLGRKQLLAALGQVEPELLEAERGRDKQLAGLAEGLRAELGEKERFARLYADIDDYDALIRQREQGLAQVDQQGASRLGELDEKLKSARERQLVLEREAEEARAIHAEADRLERRARAQVNRLDIELRNVQELARQRAAVGSAMPQDLALRFVAIEAEAKVARSSLETAEVERKQRERLLRAAEEEARRARADTQRLEAEREGYVMTHEGDVSHSAQSLDQAREGRTQSLAHAGRAVLELRGEVPVPVEVRRRIAQSDRLVEVAARKRAVLVRAAGSADTRMVATGRLVCVCAGVALLLALLWTAVR